MLALKLLLVPALLAVVTLAGRRWGQRVAGWLGSFPIVAGPILLILTLENGAAFGAEAAARALAGVVATMGFFVLYARLAPRLAWPAALAASTAAWLALVAWLGVLPATLAASATAALVALLVAPTAMGAAPARGSVSACIATVAVSAMPKAAATGQRVRATASTPQNTATDHMPRFVPCRKVTAAPAPCRAWLNTAAVPPTTGNSAA